MKFKSFISFLYDGRIAVYKRILKKLGLSETDSVSKDMIIDFLVSEGALELRKAPQDSQDLF